MKGAIEMLGGTAKYFAAIVVTFPTGSICTCTDGVKIFTADDGSTAYIFAIPYTGTWTVTIKESENDEGVSESFLISEEGQCESVTLSYSIDLFNSGDKCTAITGGWDFVSGSYISISLNDTSGYGSYGEANTTNQISLQGKKNLCCEVSSASTEGDNFYFGLTNELDTELLDNYKAYVTITGTGIFRLDVSKFTSTYYVSILGRAGANNWSDVASCKIKRVWLE